MDISISKVRVNPKSIPGFDKDCKNAQMRARRFKKTWKKDGVEES